MRSIPFSTNFLKFRNKFAIPERYKGTLIEKWANYWKGLLSDYKDVTVGLIHESRLKPRKTMFYILSGYGVFQCIKRNPNEEQFLKQFRSACNDVIMVHPSLQNQQSVSYLRRMQRDQNQNRLRFLSLGLFTILWEDLYDKDDCTYPAQCEFTQVNKWNFHEHILDVGFWDQYWRLEYEMYNYDVNYL